MDPQSDRAPGLSMSPPSSGQDSFVPADQSSLPPVAPATSIPASAPVPPVVVQAAAPGVPAPVADEASTDLDEEWVRRAKAIVEQTKDDPFQTSRALGKMKADYLKTRYNKDIKTAEDSSQ